MSDIASFVMLRSLFDVQKQIFPWLEEVEDSIREQIKKKNHGTNEIVRLSSFSKC